MVEKMNGCKGAWFQSCMVAKLHGCKVARLQICMFQRLNESFCQDEMYVYKVPELQIAKDGLLCYGKLVRNVQPVTKL